MIAAGVVNEVGKPKLRAPCPPALLRFWCNNAKERGGRGLPAKEVQSLLGHSSIVMTLDIYGHLFPSKADRDELSSAVKSLLA